MRGALIAMLFFAACTKSLPCRKGSIFLTLSFDDTASRADSLLIEIALDGGGSDRQPIPHRARETHGTLAIDFTAGYPSGRDLELVVVALLGDQVIGRGERPLRLGGDCATASLAVNGELADFSALDLFTPEDAAPMSGDAAGEDLAGVDLATSDLACDCFKTGQWQIDNLAPCFFTNQNVVTSTIPGNPFACPSDFASPPPQAWSTTRLKVDCSGHYRLCYTLKAGSYTLPQVSDCVIATVCSEADYVVSASPQPFPDLPGWKSVETSCAQQFISNGGYGEMSVLGLSSCGMTVSRVFNRVSYCPTSCSTMPSQPVCQSCTAGGGGNF